LTTTDLINAVRSDEDPVEVVEVLNPRIDPEELHGKFIVLDVLARDTRGHLYNIEMQVRRHADWTLRSLYYLARTLANQLQRGDDYATLKPVIGIHLMDFELFQQAQAHWCFELRDRTHPHLKLDHSLQLHLIELPKADRQRNGQQGTLTEWVSYFEHWREDTIMSEIRHTPVKQALDQLRDLSGDEEARRLAFVRERALRDERSELNAARREGREEGQVAVLTRLLTLKFGELPESVKQCLEQADEAELNLWAERILFAASLKDLFP